MPTTMPTKDTATLHACALGSGASGKWWNPAAVQIPTATKHRLGAFDTSFGEQWLSLWLIGT
uniref:Uncharacterized protein n=1 Tax=Rhizophora mucronata TaxID=61149 RepID=A0A2P2QI42_RHIMU